MEKNSKCKFHWSSIRIYLFSIFLYFWAPGCLGRKWNAFVSLNGQLSLCLFLLSLMLIIFVSQGWWCSTAIESCGTYSFVSLDPLSGCNHSPAYYFGLLLTVSYNSSSERCLSFMANISYLWDLVCLILASGPVSKMVSSQPRDLSRQACIEVSLNYLTSELVGWIRDLNVQGVLLYY